MKLLLAAFAFALLLASTAAFVMWVAITVLT
jgi:hypothetical protein